MYVTHISLVICSDNIVQGLVMKKRPVHVQVLLDVIQNKSAGAVKMNRNKHLIILSVYAHDYTMSGQEVKCLIA